MKTKNFFAGHRSGGRAERFKKMKNFFKNLMPMLLLVAGLGMSLNVWAIGEGNSWTSYKGDAQIYFDNSKTQWENVSLMKGRWTSGYYDDGGGDKGSYGQTMSHILNTKLYYVQNQNEKHMSTLAFFGVKDWGWEKDKTVTDRAAYTSGKYTNSYNEGFDGGTYLYTPANGNTDASLTKTKLSNGYSDLNKQQTVKVMVKATGQSSYVETTTFCGTITANRYTMTGASTAGSSSKTLSSDNYASGVLTSTISFTESNTTAGFTFKGWGTSSGSPATTDHTYSYTVDGEKTIYVFYEFDINVLQATSTKSSYYLHTWGDKDAGADFYKTQLANFYIIDNGSNAIDFQQKTGFGFKNGGKDGNWVGGGSKTIAQGNTWYTGVYASNNGSITKANMTYVSYVYFYYDGSSTSSSAIYLAKGYNGLSATKTPSAGSASNPTISKTYVTQGQSVTVTAQSAKSGYHFVNWTSSNGSFGNNEQMSTTFTPTANNAQAVANYAANTYTITYDPETPVNFAYTTAPTSKTYGQLVEMTFTPDANYVIASVTAYKTGASSTEVTVTKTDDTHYSFTQPAYDVTVKVEVSLSSVQVTYGTVGNGSIIGKIDDDQIGDSPADVPGGSTVVFTATPDANYTVEGWYSNSGCTGDKLQDGDNTGAAKTYTISNITEDRTVYVKFRETTRTITVVKGTGISAVSPTPTNAYVTTKSADISATLKDGYKDLVWNLGSGITPATNYTTSSNPIKVNATADGTITASATPKTYTISFDNNGGTGDVPGNVTATYDQPMPALANPFTAPVKNGHKFLGYYYGDTKYYNANGTSARTWDVDDNVTLTAKWDQIHVYIEGRFKVRASEGGAWKYTGATDGDYVSEGNSTNIEIPFIEAENKYRLNTYLYVNEAAGKIGNENYVLFISTWTQTDEFTKYKAANCTGDNFWFNAENQSAELTTSDGKNFWFSETTNFGGPIILTYDPVANTLSYTAEPEPTFGINFKSGGHGHLNVSDGIHNVGVRSGYNITAYPDAGYKFEKWTSTGGVVITDANNASTSITVTGAGTVTANFVGMKKIYFKKHSNWTGSEVYVYFYQGDHVYWNTDKSPADGNMEKGPTSANLTGNQMTEIDHVNHIYYFAIPDNWNPGNAVAFVNARQDNANPFYNTSVAGRNDFNKCLPYFVSTGDPAYYNKYVDSGDGKTKQTAYYSGGSWTSYDEETEYYLRGSFNEWAGPRDEYRFKNTNDPNIKEAIWKSITGSETIKFKVWQTCDCWYGKSGASYSGDVEMISLVNNGESSYDINYTATKMGSYQFKYNVSSQKLSITYMGDIMVQDFPEEVSVITGRQYKITPTVTLREGMTLDDLEIFVTGDSHAQFTQSGTNLIVLGNSAGTDNVIVTYRNKKNGYSVTKTLKVNVATGITLQAKTENTETSWIKTDLVHVHFWSTDGDKAQDASMTYNSESGIYSVTIPKIVDDEGDINFLFWYGENINMLGGNDAKWRQTDNMKTKVEMCYTIGYNSASDAYRVATPGTDLCESGAYQIEVSMKNGNTYLSNIVTTESESKTFSFFAPKDGDETYKGGTVRLLKDGVVLKTLTGFSQAGIYVADLGSDDITTPELYEGDYYVIAGVSGSELDDNTKMHKFTPRANTTEDYSYYWTKYTGNCTDKNVIAKVANEYNSNLSLTIGADALTQADGKVEAGNVRFSYEPTTNAFKRAILGASNSNDFLNIYGTNVYADLTMQQPLTAEQSLDLSKFTDNSDWVYEKVVYVKVNDAQSESSVILKSVFNGQTSHLLGYEIDETTGEEKKDQPKQLTVLGTGSTPNDTPYQIRISYDFKKNRLISSWEPTAGTYNSDMSINSDVLFIRTEDGNVQQVQVGIKDGGTESYKISSLQHVMFVMEIDGSTDKTSYSQYWISLPFDCQISDIFGVEGYITLDENRVAQKGTWGIMRYRGDIRAQKGWFKETDGFWEWMYENETMYAGEGYVLFFERKSITSWPTIKVGDEDKTLKRLYFPSAQAGFVMSNTVDAEHSQFECKSMRCNIKTPEDREAYDSNWRVIGPKSYNNITAQTIQTDNPYGTQTQFPHFLYTYDTSKEKGQKYVAHDGKTFNYQSFHAYMVQYEGTITWVPYTQTTPPATVAAHYVEDSNFKGGTLTIELMQNNEQLDRAFVKLDEKGTVGYDFSQDLTKITENCAQIASVSEDVLYAGNTLPLDIELVPLNVKVVANGTYDIALAQSLEGLEVRLYDAFEQTTTPLDLMSATVTLNKGEYKDRFFLQFVQKSPLSPTSFDGALEQINLPSDKTQKLLIRDQIYLINAGRIYNVLGVGE